MPSHRSSFVAWVDESKCFGDWMAGAELLPALMISRWVNLPLTTLRTVPRQLEHHHLDVSAHQPAHSPNPKTFPISPQSSFSDEKDGVHPQAKNHQPVKKFIVYHLLHLSVCLPSAPRKELLVNLCASHLSSRQCCPFPRLYRSREGVASHRPDRARCYAEFVRWGLNRITECCSDFACC